MQYVIVLEQTANNWSAYAPDVGGCIATGQTREEVVQNMQEALAFHLEGLREEQLPVPPPGTWTAIVDVPVPDRVPE